MASCGATQRFVSPDAESSTPATKTTLLDLDDLLLLNILNRLQEAPAIASYGGVNKRLRQLHVSVKGICAAIKTGVPSSQKPYTEEHLRELLTVVVNKGGGFLHHLSVSFDQDDDERNFEPAKLDWIKLVSGSIQSLKLHFLFTPDVKKLFTDLASCTNLVTLDLNLTTVVTGKMLARLLAGCKKLKKLSISEAFSCTGDSMTLISGSLEELNLSLPTARSCVSHRLIPLTLETPALRTLSTKMSISKLHLRSHSLRRIDVGCLLEFHSATPLAELHTVETGDNCSGEAVKQLLGFSGDCLEALTLRDTSVRIRDLAEILPRHLREVKTLTIVLQDRAPDLDAPVAPVSWLKFERLLVIAAKLHSNESDVYKHLYNSVVLVKKCFASSSVGKMMLLKCVFMDTQPFVGVYGPHLCAAMLRAVEDLTREYPGIASIGFTQKLS